MKENGRADGRIEEKIDEIMADEPPGDGLEDDGLSAVIRRARQMILLRNIAVAAAVSLLLITAVIFGLTVLNNRVSGHVTMDAYRFQEITSPNVEISCAQKRFLGLLGGEVQFNTYKLIEGVPVRWTTEVYRYDILGNYQKYIGDGYSPISVVEASGKGARIYSSETAQREMLFYHPGLDYGYYFDDLTKLAGMDKKEVGEVALSFDRPYSLPVVKEMLPPGVHLAWCWVDATPLGSGELTIKPEERSPYIASGELTARPDGMSPDSSAQLYGFAIHPSGFVRDMMSAWRTGYRPNDTGPVEMTEQDFLKAVESGIAHPGKHNQEYKKIYDYLRQGKDKPATQDVRILGAIVTGTIGDLQKLQGQRYVRAAVLGVTAER